VAATFAGAEELADQAFWESVALDTDEPFRVWSWGLEMYHPKWFDDAEKLARVARAAAAANYDQAGEALSIAEQLGAYGFPQLRMELLRRALVQAKQRAAAHPTLASAHFVLGEALNEVGRRAEARTAWEAAAALDREGTIRRDCEVRLAKYPAGTKAPEGPQPLPRVR
jgi:tetratricopeptide (TPR) repeat protein